MNCCAMRALLVLLLTCAGLLEAFKAQVATTDRQSHPNALQFVAFGDWGKGGISGDILSVDTNSLNIHKGVGVNKHLHSLRGGFEVNDGGEHDEHGHGNQDHEREQEGGHSRQEYTYQVAVAAGISAFVNSSDLNTSFIVALGDNFYDDGVLSVNDTMWSTHWEQVYLQNYSNLRIPWFPVFGNHDYGYGDEGVRAQLEYTKKSETSRTNVNNVWHFDSFNYSKCFDIPQTYDGMVCLIFVDTTTLAPSEERNCNEEGGVSTNMQAARIKNQLSHIRKMLYELKDSTWLIVCGHYPVYTSGEHGDNAELIETLQPLLDEYNVSIYLAGHDHLSGHLHANNTEYFIAGGGAMVDPLGDKKSVAKDMWYGVGYAAFSVFRVSGKSLSFHIVHWNGTEMYNYTLNNPRRLASEFQVVDSQVPTIAPTIFPSDEGGSFRSDYFDNEIPSIYLAVAVAAGSVAGLLVCIAWTPRRRKDKMSKQKKCDKTQSRSFYSSLPPETPKNCDQSVDAYAMSPQRASSPSTATQREIYSPVSRLSTPSTDVILSPRQYQQRESFGLSSRLLMYLSRAENSCVGSDHRKTKSKDQEKSRRRCFESEMGHRKCFSYAETT